MTQVLGQGYIEILPETEGFLGTIDKQIEELMGGLGGPLALVGAAIGGTIAGLGALGEKYEDVFHTIERTTGATGDTLEGLKASFKDVYGTTASSAEAVTQAIDAIYQKTGLTGQALDDFARKEVELAKITKSDVAANVAETTTLFNKFGVAAGDQSKELDVLFKASQKSGASLGDLAGQLESGATPLKAFGFSLDEATALFAAFDRAGISTQKSTADLNRAFVTLTKEGLDPSQAKKHLEDLFAALESGKDPTNTEAEALKLFGQRSGLELVQAVQEGKLHVDDLFKSITDGKGGIDDTTASTQSLGDKFDILAHKAQDALQPLASKLLDEVNKGVDDLNSAMNSPGFKTFADNLSNGAQIINKDLRSAINQASSDWGTFMSGFEHPDDKARPGLSGLQLLLYNTGQSVRGLTDDTKREWPKFLNNFELGAYIISTKTVPAFQSLRSEGVSNITELVYFTDTHYPQVQTIFDNVNSGIRSGMHAFGGGMKQEWGLLHGDLKDTARGGWTAIDAFLEGTWHMLLDNWAEVVDLFSGNWAQLWVDVKKTASDGLKETEGLISGSEQFFSGAAKTVWDALIDQTKKSFKELDGDLSGIGNDLMRGLSGGIRDAEHFVLDELQSLVDQIPEPLRKGLHLSSPSRLFHDFGRWTVEGFALGVSDNAFRAYDAMAELTSGIGGVGALSARLGGSARIDLNIHAPGATQDTVAALRHVAQTEIAQALRGVVRATTSGAGSR